MSFFADQVPSFWPVLLGANIISELGARVLTFIIKDLNFHKTLSC